MSKPINNNENRSMCAQCQSCCTHPMSRPGGFHPDQIEPWQEEVLVRNGSLEWDYHESFTNYKGEECESFQTYWYLRPARKPDGSCKFHSPTAGCLFSWKDRPFECKALIPKANAEGKCHSTLGEKASRALGILWFLAGRQ